MVLAHARLDFGDNFDLFVLFILVESFFFNILAISLCVYSKAGEFLFEVMSGSVLSGLLELTHFAFPCKYDTSYYLVFCHFTEMNAPKPRFILLCKYAKNEFTNSFGLTCKSSGAAHNRILQRSNALCLFIYNGVMRNVIRRFMIFLIE